MTHRGPFQPLLFCDSVIPPEIRSKAARAALQSSQQSRKLSSGFLCLIDPQQCPVFQLAPSAAEIRRFSAAPQRSGRVDILGRCRSPALLLGVTRAVPLPGGSSGGSQMTTFRVSDSLPDGVFCYFCRSVKEMKKSHWPLQMAITKKKMRTKLHFFFLSVLKCLFESSTERWNSLI